MRPILFKERTSNPQYLSKMIFLSQQKFYVTIRDRKPLDEIASVQELVGTIGIAKQDFI